MAAVEAAVAADQAVPAPAPPEQLQLLPPEPARPPGRPAGSINRRSADLVAYLDAQGARPSHQLAKLLGPGDPFELIEAMAKRLGVAKVEAFDRYVRVAETLLRYTERQLAELKVEADSGTAGAIGAGMGMLHLAALQALSAQQGGGEGVVGPTVESSAQELEEGGDER